MDFKQLEAFSYVVRYGSFSKAAEHLYLTQPTVSAHVSSLEKELGVQLIVRTPKEVYASETGKILYDYALSMLSLRENAIAECKSKQSDVSGSILIAASTVTYRYVLPQVMSQFREKHPGIRFEIHSCDSEEVVSAILSGKAEIGMTGAMMDEKKCAYTDFMEDQLYVITPKSAPYLSIPGDCGFSVASLREYPFIIREPGSGTRKETEAFLNAHGLGVENLHIAAQMEEPDAIKNAVAQGLGISIVSRFVVEDFIRQGLVLAFPLEGEPIKRKLYLVSHKNRSLSPAASSFMRFVKEYYQNKP